MRRTTLALSVAIASVAAAVGLVAMHPRAEAAVTATSSVHRVGTEDFADPGFAHFGSKYYLFRTGAGYGTRWTTSTGWSAIHKSMTAIPAWVDHAKPLLWAPEVFQSSDSHGALYVMYFTGESASRHVHCIGVATSRNPAGTYTPGSKPVVCSPWVSRGYEAIDPAAYRAKDGKRYLIYKSDYKNASGFQIRAVQMDTQTGTRVVGSSIAKIVSSTKIEGPSVIAHGGRVWLFTSRGDYINCSYNTDVWSASTFWGGRFTRVKTLMTTASTRLCGPGGATVINVGSTTRIAFHAYVDANHNGVKDSSTRQAYTGILKWDSSGRPYLA
ncbi:glycoside hydrolase family 43 protein [Kribbella karoonensis]|uniref:Glycoside hydrolase family 43 protein n=2 Tax=Kribbella karoonensis TaxID=324851 RepID=A0ABN2EI63_9ACTN